MFQRRLRGFPLRALAVFGLLASSLGMEPSAVGAAPLTVEACPAPEFAKLASAIGSANIGQCIGVGYTDRDSQSVIQPTSGGLLTSNLSGGWTAFTDGTSTWVAVGGSVTKQTGVPSPAATFNSATLFGTVRGRPGRAVLVPKHAALPAVSASKAGSTVRATDLGSGPLTYHGGPVERTPSINYAVYWLPPASTMSPPYANLINRYLADIGGSQLFALLTQYSDSGGAIINSAEFGGSWTDTRPFPNTTLSDSDIQSEVINALNATGWNAVGVNANIYVFTPQGVQSCLSPGICSDIAGGFCAYHSSFTAFNGVQALPLRYSDMPYGGNDPYACGFTSSPNGDIASDTEISVLSHEQFETVSDPDGTAWYDALGYEIGDKCQGAYGALNGSGADVVINGHPYIVQEEWNNATNSCALTLGGVAAVCSPRPPVSVSTLPTGDGRLQVTVSTSGTGVALQSIQFQSTTNALIDIGSSLGVSGTMTINLSTGTTTVTFFVRRGSGSSTATVPMTVTDSCGAWPTFVGGGASAF